MYFMFYSARVLVYVLELMLCYTTTSDSDDK